MIRKVLTFVLILLIGTTSVDANEVESSSAVEHDLQLAIRNLHSEARILQLKDMDLRSCGPLEIHPGLVKADFNGDGKKDFAVLLIVGGVKKENEWGGRVWKLRDLWFVVFMGDRPGAFKDIIIDKIETYLPSGMGIDIQPPGIVRKWDSNLSVKLRNPGIERFICERSAAVFYWRGEKFEVMLTSD